MENETEVEVESQLDQTDATDTPQEGTGDAFAVFGGEELKVEARRPDAHLGVILAITRFDSPNTGSPAIQVVLQSQNTGNQDEWTIFVPKPFVAETGKFLRGELTIEDLSPGYPDPERPGKIKGNERNQYGMSYKNSAGDAAVQRLLSAAAKAGRSPEAGVKIETFDEFIGVLNTLCQDLQVVYTRRVNKSEDNPRGFLNVNNVFSPTDIIDEDGNTKPKQLRNYVKHWETEAL